MSAAQERTEPATPRRRERARLEGDQPRSALASAAAVTWFAIVVGFVAPHWALWWANAYAGCAVDAAAAGRAADAAADLSAIDVAGRSIEAWIPVVIATLAAFAGSLVAAAACGAIGWSPGALRWRLARLSPAAGARSLFAVDSMTQTAMTLCAAVGILACAAAAAIRALAGAQAGLPPSAQPMLASSVIATFWLRVAIVSSALAVVDVALARRRHARRLRMTPREVRDERAEQEGRPETRARMRSIAVRRGRRLRVTAMKRAVALVTNPTHVAVALQYEPPQIDVPVVLASGAEEAAAILRTAAAYYDVPVIESPDLARALFARVDVDEPIPEELYAGVAAVFAWILKTRGRLGAAPSA